MRFRLHTSSVRSAIVAFLSLALTGGCGVAQGAEESAQVEFGGDLRSAVQKPLSSLISLPFNTSQAGFTPRQRSAMGIDPGYVRLSVGIEDPEDLIADFDQALTSICS